MSIPLAGHSPQYILLSLMALPHFTDKGDAAARRLLLARLAPSTSEARVEVRKALSVLLPCVAPVVKQVTITSRHGDEHHPSSAVVGSRRFRVSALVAVAIAALRRASGHLLPAKEACSGAASPVAQSSSVVRVDPTAYTVAVSELVVVCVGAVTAASGERLAVPLLVSGATPIIAAANDTIDAFGNQRLVVRPLPTRLLRSVSGLVGPRFLGSHAMTMTVPPQPLSDVPVDSPLLVSVRIVVPPTFPAVPRRMLILRGVASGAAAGRLASADSDDGLAPATDLIHVEARDFSLQGWGVRSSSADRDRYDALVAFLHELGGGISEGDGDVDDLSGDQALRAEESALRPASVTECVELVRLFTAARAEGPAPLPPLDVAAKRRRSSVYAAALKEGRPLSEGVGHSVKAFAVQTLRVCWYPLLILKQVRRRRRLRLSQFATSIPRLTGAVLQRSVPTSLQGLPGPMFEALAQTATLRCFETGEVIAYAGEPSPGLCLVAHGAVDINSEAGLYHGSSKRLGFLTSSSGPRRPAAAALDESSTGTFTESAASPLLLGSSLNFSNPRFAGSSAFQQASVRNPGGCLVPGSSFGMLEAISGTPICVTLVAGAAAIASTAVVGSGSGGGLVASSPPHAAAFGTFVGNVTAPPPPAHAVQMLDAATCVQLATSSKSRTAPPVTVTGPGINGYVAIWVISRDALLKLVFGQQKATGHEASSEAPPRNAATAVNSTQPAMKSAPEFAASPTAVSNFLSMLREDLCHAAFADRTRVLPYLYRLPLPSLYPTSHAAPSPLRSHQQQYPWAARIKLLFRNCRFTSMSKCSLGTLERLVSAMQPRSVPRGSTVVARGRPATEVWFLLGGRVGVFRAIPPHSLSTLVAAASPLPRFCDVTVLQNGGSLPLLSPPAGGKSCPPALGGVHHVETFRAPCELLMESAVYGGPVLHDWIALTDLDAYVIPASQFSATLAGKSDVVSSDQHDASRNGEGGMTLITGSTMERTSTNVTTMSSMSPQDPSSPPAGSTNSDWAVASAEWSRSRAERLRHVVSRCRAQVAGILFIDDLLRRDRGGTATTELLALFQARMLQPGELLTCRSDFCDRLVIPIEGVLRFTHHNDKDDAVVREVAERAREQHRNLDGGTLLSAAAIPDDPCVVPLNECLGFSCLVSHRWTRSVVAATVCRVIELERADYEAFLRRRGWLALVAARTRLLLFPNALSVGVVPKPGTLASLVRAMLNRSGGIQQRGGGGPPGGHAGPVGGMSLGPLMFAGSGSGTVAPH